MQFLVEKITNLRIEWNKRPLTEDDFYRLCKRFKITLQEMPLSVSGFYYCMKRRHFIAVDSKLEPRKKLFVMFHEFAHFLMHAPDTGVTANFHGIGKKTRKEIEADAFALIAMIPRSKLELSTLEELAVDEGFPIESIRERIRILKEHGV